MTPKEKGWEELMNLIRQGHEAVINHEEVEEYEKKVKSFIKSVREEAIEQTVREILGIPSGCNLYDFETTDVEAIYKNSIRRYAQSKGITLTDKSND